MEHTIAPIELKNMRASLYVFGDLNRSPSLNARTTKEEERQSGFQRECWEQFRSEAKADPNPYYLGLGDYDDFTRPSLRPLLQGALGKDQSARRSLDNLILNENDKTLGLMEFMKGRVVGIHEGHHNWTTLDGTHTDQRVATALRAKFLGFIGSTRLVLGHPGGKSQKWAYTIVSTHGNPGGKKVHSSLAWLEGSLASGFIADQYVCGHGCKSANMTAKERHHIRRVGPAGADLKLPRILVVGGFTRSYTDGFISDYVERAGMEPQPPGWGVIRFHVVERVGTSLMHGVLPGHGKHNGPSSNRGTKTLDVEQVNRHPNGDQFDA